MAKPIDLAGQRFERLVALTLSTERCGTVCLWECMCDCGTRTLVRSTHLRGGRVRSCGCLRRELFAVRSKELRRTHGLSKTPAYKNWRNMRDRCYNPAHAGFESYGGRGITVCDRWRGASGFENFMADMGPRPPGHTLERQNNDGPYCPENCVWATPMEQAQNRRTNVLLEIDGVTQTVAAWARQHGVYASTIHARIRRGISGQALFARHRISHRSCPSRT